MKYFKIILALILAAPCYSYGKPLDYKASLANPVDISAHFLEHKKEENVYIAKGDVDVREGTRMLNADSVMYDENNREVFAEGNVVFKDGDDTIECEKLHLNLITKTGTIEKGRIFIKKGNFTITGEQIDKVGDNKYKIANGAFTTCEGEKPHWRFAAQDVQITVEGYAKTSSARFQILNQTVFYFPWGMFPVKTERQSGLLLPEFALSSRDGMTIKTSYFWAISKDKDATFYLDYTADRGFKPGAEFRYAFRDDMKGSWYYSIIKDNKYENTRYQLLGKHEQTVLNDATLKTNINYVNDKDYLQDFGKDAAERSENLLKSTAYVEKPFKKSLLTYEMSYFRSMLQRDNDRTFKYLPFVTFFTEYIPIMKDRLYTDIYTDFTNFYREKGDKFSRFSLEPRVSVPYSWNGINFLFNGTLYETGYIAKYAGAANNNSEWRQTAKIEADSNVQFLRNYNFESFDIGEMQSLIRPRLKYTYIPNTSFADIPYIDPYDRMYQTNTLTYSFNHYLNSFTPEGSRELSLFEIEQTYGLSESLRTSTLYEGAGGRFSDIKAKLTLYPIDNLSFTHEDIINTGGDGLRMMRNSLNHQRPSVYNVNISHSYTNDLVNEIYYDIGGKYKYFEGKHQMRYSFQDGMWIDTLYQLVYRPQCWAITLTLIQSKRPRDTTFRLSFDLAGITSRQTK